MPCRGPAVSARRSAGRNVQYEYTSFLSAVQPFFLGNRKILCKMQTKIWGKRPPMERRHRNSRFVRRKERCSAIYAAGTLPKPRLPHQNYPAVSRTVCSVFPCAVPGTAGTGWAGSRRALRSIRISGTFWCRRLAQCPRRLAEVRQMLCQLGGEGA